MLDGNLWGLKDINNTAERLSHFALKPSHCGNPRPFRLILYKRSSAYIGGNYRGNCYSLMYFRCLACLRFFRLSHVPKNNTEIRSDIENDNYIE